MEWEKIEIRSSCGPAWWASSPILLAGFKAFVGMMSHSVAITMDALNNLSDAMSSLITIVGTRLAANRRIGSILWDTRRPESS